MRAPDQRCPCCGGPITHWAVVVDLNSNTIAVGWRPEPILLRPTTAELAWTLVQAMPTAVRVSTLIDRIWGIGECDNADMLVRVHISALRRKIIPLDLAVATVRGIYGSRGAGAAYRLVTTSPRPRA